jgi:hypothetical protein
MKFEDFTPEERYIIAEFVYAYDSDTMIKSEALKLVDIFKSKEILDEEKGNEFIEKILNNHYILEELIETLFTAIPEEEGKKIMQEYFSSATF